MKTNDSIQSKHLQYISKGYSSATGCYVQSASGALVMDIHGKKYVDFGGGIAVMNVGHSHPKVVSAIQEQAEKFTHTCFMVLPYEPVIALAEKLCNTVPGKSAKSAVTLNSGAEAVENAVKIARYFTKKSAIISFENAFHGRTLMGMSLTSKIKPYKLGFGPFAPEIYRAPFAYCYRCQFKQTYPSCNVQCADYLEDFLITHVALENTAAIIAEPIQGEGGFITPPPEYFPKLKSICDEYEILFIADEIQTGMGRTGRMFALEHWDIEADLTTVAKSLAAGMPLSAVVGRKKIMDSVHAGGIGGTYGGNPVSCAAALAVLDIFESENLLKTSQRMGNKLQERLMQFSTEFELIGDVRGIGPMQAIELVTDREKKTPAGDAAKRLTSYCFLKGLILLSCGVYGNVIRFIMPLNIPDEQLERGLSIVEDGLNELTS